MEEDQPGDEPGGDKAQSRGKRPWGPDHIQQAT